MLSRDKIDKIFERFKSNNDNPKIELNYKNHFTLLVAIILSARTTDVSVNKVTDKLFHVADSAKKIFELGENNLKNYISKIGLYNAKAKNIIALSKIILDKYHNIIPKDFYLLIELPGIGRKSANVFLNAAFGMPTIGVDTHVFRVSNRLGLVKEKSILSTEKELLRVVPKKWLSCAHNWLVLHGRYICKARNPLCSICYVKDLCEYYMKYG